MNIGLFCENTEFWYACGASCLHKYESGLFCENMGLFCKSIGLFCENKGLFCENIGPFCENLDFFGAYTSTLVENINNFDSSLVGTSDICIYVYITFA